MPTNCKLSIPEPGDSAAWLSVETILERSNAALGSPVVSDQALLEAKQGRRALTLLSLNERAQGFAILGSGELDLVVDPAWRGRGLATCALTALLGEEQPASSSELRTWVHGIQPAAEKLLTDHGFAPARTLLRLEHDVTDPEETSSAPTDAPAGFVFTPFQPADAPAWVTLNARVFADHPEQGALTGDDLTARLSESWFNADDFILLRRGEELVGYCWLKVVDDEGEIYVIGVSPDCAGQGLGGALFDQGLRRLAERGVTRITLYVEADNLTAIRLYESRGFRRALKSTQWVRSEAQS